MPRIKRLNYWNLAERGFVAYEEQQPQAIAVDTETTGFTWYDTAFCATVAWENEAHYFELDDPDSNSMLEAMLHQTPTLIFHNAKFDLQKLIRADVLDRDSLSGHRIEDTEALYYLLDPFSVKKLKVLAERILGETTNEAKALSVAKKRLQTDHKAEFGTTLYSKDIGYDRLPRPVLYPYALKDAEFTYRIWDALRPRVVGDLYDLYRREMDLTLVLLDMEAAGMRVDTEYTRATIKRINGQILDCEHNIKDLTGMDVWYPERQGQKTPEGKFNPNAWQQIQAVFKDRGVEIANTQEATLAALDDELAQAIVDLRGDKKLVGTYLQNIIKEQQSGIIHVNLKQHEAKTGRTTSASEKGD